MSRKKERRLQDFQRDYAKLKTTTSLLAEVLIFLFGLTLYNTIKNGKFDVMMVVAIALSPILFVNLAQIKKIKV